MIRLLAAFLLCQLLCDGHIVYRRDPLDGALDATVIAIVSLQPSGAFRAEKVFLGDVASGDLLFLPGFKLTVEDRSALIAGVDREEPIYRNTRVLVFLKPASANTIDSARLGRWMVAGFGNCYFWSHDANQTSALESMASSVLALRQSWQAARDLPDEQKRVEALWPYLWDGHCYRQTEAALQEIGPVAGDYLAEQLDGMTYRQKDVFLSHFASYGSTRLHTALIHELKKQQAAWEDLVRRHGRFATFDQIDRPGRMRYSVRRPQDSEADEADDIYGVLYQGFVGLGNFHDRNDLPFLRESALWAVKYRFKQVDDAALDAFTKLPDAANLPVIEAIQKEYSKKPFVGNKLDASAVATALDANRRR